MTQGYDNDRQPGHDPGPPGQRAGSGQPAGSGQDAGSDLPEHDVWTGEDPDAHHLLLGDEPAASQPPPAAGAGGAGRGGDGRDRGGRARAADADDEGVVRETTPGSAPIDRLRRRIERTTGGRPISALMILATAALVLVVLFVVIVVTGEEDETNPGVPCIVIELPDALDAIVDGEVEAIRATSPRGDIASLAVAVEMDMADGTCRAISQAPEAAEDRVAVLGAAMVYNDQTEQRQIDISINVADLPATMTPTATTAPTMTPLPTQTATPTQVPTQTPVSASTPLPTPAGFIGPELVAPTTAPAQ